MGGQAISVSEKTYHKLMKLKEELKEELDLDDVSVHQVIQHLINSYKKRKSN
jgi:predicted CopG family antitoxin